MGSGARPPLLYLLAMYFWQIAESLNHAVPSSVKYDTILCDIRKNKWVNTCTGPRKVPNSKCFIASNE